jgi:hypothetical protein
MIVKAPFNRLILRAVLRNVSPMVIRVISVPDSLRLFDFNEVFLAVLRGVLGQFTPRPASATEPTP